VKAGQNAVACLSEAKHLEMAMALARSTLNQSVTTTRIFLVHQGLAFRGKLMRTQMFSSCLNCRPQINTLGYSAANTSGYLMTFKAKFYHCYLTLSYNSCCPKSFLTSITHWSWMKRWTADDMKMPRLFVCAIATVHWRRTQCLLGFMSCSARMLQRCLLSRRM